MSSPFAGAEINTFFGPDLRCALAFSASVNTPVDSITKSTPSSPQGISAGSLCEVILISLPSTKTELPSTFTFPGNLPNVESYFNK